MTSLPFTALDQFADFTAPVAEPDNFFSGLLTGWNAFVAFFAGLLVALGVLLPWLVFLGIIAVIVIAIVKRRMVRPVAVPEPVDSP